MATLKELYNLLDKVIQKKPELAEQQVLLAPIDGIYTIEGLAIHRPGRSLILSTDIESYMEEYIVDRIGDKE